MGSTMKPTVFNERVAAALRNWHQTARKHIKKNKGSITPVSSRPNTPSHHMSPVHLLRHYRCEVDSFNTSARRSNFDGEHWEAESPSPNHYNSNTNVNSLEQGSVELSCNQRDDNNGQESTGQVTRAQHEIDIDRNDFSFEGRNKICR